MSDQRRHPQARRLRSLLGPVVAPALAFLLVGLCWAITSPPGVGVDEPSHYIRTVGLAHGHLVGRDVPADRPLGSLTAEQLKRVNSESGAYDLPGNQREPLPCNVFEPEQPFACAQYPVVPGTAEHVSFHAKYLPGAYFLPAVLARFGTSMWRTVLLVRLGFLLQDTVLFTVVLLALRCRRALGSGLSTAGGMLLALTATPVVGFQIGTTSPSSTEILGAAAFAAALGAMAIAPRTWRWVVVACGVFECWSRDLGVVAVLLAIAAWFVVDPRVRSWWRNRTRADAAGAAVLTLGVLGAIAWQVLVKAGLQARPDSVTSVWDDLGTVPAMLHNSVGLLGWLNYRIDPTVDAVWSFTWLVLLVVLVVRADRWTRWMVGGGIAAYVGMNLVLIDGLRAGGFGAQPRFTLPIVAVIVVVLAARDRPPAVGEGWWYRWRTSAGAVLVACGHVAALLISAHRHANGIGTPFDLHHAAWSPPGRWNAGLALMGLAAVSIVLPVVVGALRIPRQAPPEQPLVTSIGG